MRVIDDLPDGCGFASHTPSVDVFFGFTQYFKLLLQKADTAHFS